MVALSTTTDANKLKYPGVNRIDRQAKTGWLFHVSGDGTQLQVWRSANGGASWAAFGGPYTLPGGMSVVEMGSLFIDYQNRMYVPFRVNVSGQDRVYLYAGVITDTYVSSHSLLLVASASNGGVAGSAFTGMAPGIVRHGDGRTTGFVAVAFQSGTQMGVRAYGFTIPAVGQPVLNNAIVAGTREWKITEAAGGHQVPSVDYELSPAHTWITFGRTYAHAVKLNWNGAGWNGPSTAVRLSAYGPGIPAPPATDSMAAIWRNPGWCTAQPYQYDTTQVVVWERNQANTKTTPYITPSHPAGVVKNCTLTVDWPTRNLRIYAVGTSDAQIRYIDYVTATGSWGAWSGTGWVVTGSDNYSSRRRTDGNARYDILWLSGASSPYTINHNQQTAVYAPYTPTWVYSQTDPKQPGASGVPMDVGQDLILRWKFSDPDPGDTQSAWALSRQIGAGATQYFRASDSTWQSTEQKNVSGALTVTLPAGWAIDSNPSLSFRVKTWDQSDTASGYSSVLSIIPTVPAVPIIASPVSDGDVVSSTYLDLAWTLVDQAAYRVILRDGLGVQVYDTGWTPGQNTSTTLPYAMSSGTYSAQLQVRNSEGFVSPTANTRTFVVSVVPPPTPALTATPVPGEGVIRVAITNPPPTYLNTNNGFEAADPTFQGDFDVDMTGWVGVNATAVRSTTQSHAGGASAFVTPSGSGVVARVECDLSLAVPVVAGQTVTASAWVRPTNAGKPAAVQIAWRDAGGSFLSSTVQTATATAGAWQFITVTGTAPATAVYALPGAGIGSTPTAADTAYVDEVRLTTVPGYTAVSGTLVRSTAQAKAGSVSGLFTPTGGQIDAYVRSAPAAVGVPGSVYTLSGWLRPTTASKTPIYGLQFYNNGTPTVIATNMPSPGPANTWTQYSYSVVMPAGSNQVAGVLGITATPGPSDTYYVDEIYVTSGGTPPAVASNTVQRRVPPVGLTEWDFTPGVQGWAPLAGTGTSVWDGFGNLIHTPSGSSSSTEARSPNVPGVSPGQTWQATALIKPSVSRTVSIQIIWRDAGGALTGGLVATAYGLTAGVPATITTAGIAPAGAAQAFVSISYTGTPPTSHIMTIMEAELRNADIPYVPPTTIATGVPAGGTYDDWTAVPGVEYQYRIATYGDNGTVGYSSWTS